MPLTFVREEDIDALTRIRMGIVARNGTGKTTWLTTIPKTERVLVISADTENIRPLVKHPHIRVVKVQRWNDLQDVFDAVSGMFKPDRKPVKPGSEVTVLAFDTWSRIQDLAIGKVTGYEPIDPQEQRQYIDRIPRSVKDWTGWNQVGSLMAEWMRYFNSLPVHLVYLMQENTRESKFEDSPETGPRLTPFAATAIKDSLEVIGRMYVELEGKEVDISADALLSADGQGSRKFTPDAKEERCLFIGQDPRYFAKGPTHLLGRVVRNPSWGNVVVPILTQTPLETKEPVSAVPAHQV